MGRQIVAKGLAQIPDANSRAVQRRFEQSHGDLQAHRQAQMEALAGHRQAMMDAQQNRFDITRGDRLSRQEQMIELAKQRLAAKGGGQGGPQDQQALMDELQQLQALQGGGDEGVAGGLPTQGIDTQAMLQQGLQMLQTPQGQQQVGQLLASPQGQQMAGQLLSTPQGQEVANNILGGAGPQGEQIKGMLQQMMGAGAQPQPGQMGAGQPGMAEGLIKQLMSAQGGGQQQHQMPQGAPQGQPGDELSKMGIPPEIAQQMMGGQQPRPQQQPQMAQGGGAPQGYLVDPDNEFKGMSPSPQQMANDKTLPKGLRGLQGLLGELPQQQALQGRQQPQVPQGQQPVPQGAMKLDMPLDPREAANQTAMMALNPQTGFPVLDTDEDVEREAFKEAMVLLDNTYDDPNEFYQQAVSAAGRAKLPEQMMESTLQGIQQMAASKYQQMRAMQGQKKKPQLQDALDNRQMF